MDCVIVVFMAGVSNFILGLLTTSMFANKKL